MTLRLSLPLALATLALAMGCASTPTCAPRPRAPAASTDPAKAEAIRELVREAMTVRHARAVLVRATLDGKEILTEAFGESATGVPATTDMHFRNGAVAISFVAMALLQLVDEKKVSLDDKVSTWLPTVPDADRVTLGQLARMTSGYEDHVQSAEFLKALYENPFRTWTTDELLGFVANKPLIFEPGTNWAYGHTNYVILGLALEKITGRPMKDLLQEKVLGPLCLTETTDPQSAEVPAPVLHAYTSERRQALGVPAGVPFYEESTSWDPSWALTHGALQVTDLSDLHDSAVAFGTGALLSPESFAKMVSTDLRGTTTPVPGCNTCVPQSVGYAYGVGLVTSGNWLLQNPDFAGYAGTAAYLPSQKAAIAVVVTFKPEAFDENGEHKFRNEADTLMRKIGAVLAPNDAPPMPPMK